MSSSNKMKTMSDSDDSTEDLILREDSSLSPNGMLSTEPYLNYVVQVPPRGTEGKCNSVNKLLMLIILLLLLLCVVFICLYFHPQHRITKLKSASDKYCTTTGCVEAAAFMKLALDESTDPCEDFYIYSCGGWIGKNPIPDGKSTWAIDSWLWKQNLQIMKTILENTTVKEGTLKSNAEYESFKFYRSCRDMAAINKQGVKPLVEMLKKIGGFANRTTNTEKDNKAKLKELLIKMATVSYMTPFFSLVVGPDDKDSKTNILKISQSGLGLALYRYKENGTNKVIQAYIGYLTELGVKLKIGIKRADLHEMAKETYNFEKELSKVFVPPEERITVEQVYDKITIAEFHKMVPNIGWITLADDILATTGIKIYNQTNILVQSKKYFTKLGSVLHNTPIRVIQNYIMFRVATTHAAFLTEDIILLSKNLTIAKTGVYKEIPRWKLCVQATDSSIGMALGALFVRKAFAKNSYEEANNMVGAVRNAFIDTFQTLKWMDRETQKAAKDKANVIVQSIGYPPFILDAKKLNAFYNGLTFTENAFFKNVLKANKFSIIKNLRKIKQPVDNSEWYMTPPTINAYYDPSTNQIVFPAGILKPPYFSADYPKAVNYGGMGAVIGHEITHGFDNNGRLYDKYGNYRGKGKSWWTKHSVDEFKQKTKCFVEEYSKFTEAKHHIKGNVTLGENIADNGGLKAAYKAYQQWVKKHGEELLLPGLSKTNDQVFFIAFGQSWCTEQLNAILIEQIETDVHSPAIERVRGAVQNNKDFARAFNCKLGSTMNPAKKCSIW